MNRKLQIGILLGTLLFSGGYLFLQDSSLVKGSINVTKSSCYEDKNKSFIFEKIFTRKCVALKATIGDVCKSDSSCISNNCLSGVCARGSLSEGSSCNNLLKDDECDYGLSCLKAGRSSVCALKVTDSFVCKSDSQCISGKCDNGRCSGSDAYSVCAIVNDASIQAPIDDVYVKDVVAKASDMVFERTGKRFTLQEPIVRVNFPMVSHDVYQISATYRQWLNDKCYTSRSTNPPNGALIYGGDLFLLQSMPSANGFTVVSEDLSSQGFINSWPSSHYGTTRIPAGSIKKKNNTKTDAVSVFHEILNQYDGDGADVHEDMSICAQVMGERYLESKMVGLSYSAIGWGAVCPYLFNNFVNIDRQVGSPSRLKVIGQQCQNNSECGSGFCESPTGSYVNSISAPYKMCMKPNLNVGDFCLSDSSCGSGVCLGLRCQSSLPNGRKLPDSSLCTNNSQCSSGLCLGSKCFTKLASGERCLDAGQCSSNACDNYACAYINRVEGQTCSATSQCLQGLTCDGGRCLNATNRAAGAYCSNSSQCATGLVCFNSQCFIGN